MVIRKKQMKFLGHIMRKREFVNMVFTEYVKGRRTRGLQRETFLSGITGAMEVRMSVAGRLQMTVKPTIRPSMVA